MENQYFLSLYPTNDEWGSVFFFLVGQQSKRDSRPETETEQADVRQTADAMQLLPRWRYMICNISKQSSQKQNYDEISMCINGIRFGF